MPNKKAAEKRVRSDVNRQFRNLNAKSELKTLTKKFVTALQDKKLAEAKAAFMLLVKRLDQAGKRNIMHKNTISRKQSRMAKQLAKLK